MSIGALVLLSLALGLAAWLFFMWTVRSGQYEDPEGPKYRMLEDDEEPPLPPGPGPSAPPDGPGPDGGSGTPRPP